MNRQLSTTALVFSCNDQGHINHVYQDDLNILERVSSELSFLSIISQQDSQKAQDFFLRLKHQTLLLDWALSVTISQQEHSLYFGGSASNGEYVIAAVPVQDAPPPYYPMLIQLNNEETAPIHQQQTVQSNSDEELYNELMRVNNELVNLQRVLAITNNQLREQRDYLRVLMANIMDAIIVTDTDGHVMFMNDTARLMTGCERQHAEGRCLKEILVLDHLTHSGPLIHSWNGSQAYQSTPAEATAVFPAAGMRVPVDYVFVPITDGEDIIGHMITLRDITERKRMETVTLERERYKVALEKQQELNQLKNRMMERVTHEFRTPLAVIFSSTDIISRYRERMTETQYKDKLDKIRSQIHHLTKLLDDIKQVIHEENTAVYSDEIQFSIEDILRDVLHDLRTWTADRQIHIDIAPDADSAFGNVEALRQVVTHLLSNALKYSEIHTPVVLRVWFDDTLNIEISDEGFGISPQEKPYIFDPLYRGSNIREVGGLGLGLTIVNQILTAQGGILRIDSKPGRGTIALAQFKMMKPVLVPA